MKIIEVVHITWIDSESHNEWIEVSSLDGDLTLNHTVGFLVHSDQDIYVISSSYDPENDAVNGTMVIPRVAVKSLETLALIDVSKN